MKVDHSSFGEIAGTALEKCLREAGSSIRTDATFGVYMQHPTAVYLTDGMALVQKLKVDHFSFGEIADKALARVLREGGSSIRTDVGLGVT